MEIDLATRLAVFMREYGGWAIASLAIIALVIRDRDYRRSEREKYELALQIAPLAEKMMLFFQRASKPRRRKPTQLVDAFVEQDKDKTPSSNLPMPVGAWKKP